MSITMSGEPPVLSRKSKMMASAWFKEAIAAIAVDWQMAGSGNEFNFR